MFKIRTRKNQLDYVPGETIDVKVFWDVDEFVREHDDEFDEGLSPVDRLELRLVWSTEGKGSTNFGVAISETIENPALKGEETIRLKLPKQPYSFSGRLISIVWALEFVALPLGSPSTRREIVIAPNGKEVRVS